MDNDQNSNRFMRRAIELAELGGSACRPNPRVGAVIVKDGKIIGEGYHKRCGDLHAERNAIASLTSSAEGAALYVTLEPCCHHGKTPPCTEAVIGSGIKKVFIGSSDPNPKVSGKGVKILRDAGIEVIEGVLKEDCDRLNPVFFHFISSGMPFVTLKYAMTMDGKIATETGASKWISCEDSRKRVHEMRGAHAAVMAGIGTVIADDPMLNCRLPGLIDPIRIICDSRLRIPIGSKIIKTAETNETIIAAAIRELPDGEIISPSGPLSEKIAALLDAGVNIINVSANDRDETDIPALFRSLGKMCIDSVLIEGGGTLAESVIRSGLVNEVYAFIAPKIFGGHAKSPVEGCGVNTPDDAYKFKLVGSEMIGEDILLKYMPERRD